MEEAYCGLVSFLLRTAPQLPGVNLPISHVFYFVLAIGLNAVAHELGHAVAAVWCASPLMHRWLSSIPLPMARLSASGASAQFRGCPPITHMQRVSVVLALPLRTKLQYHVKRAATT
jgi:hypothetical protein